MGEIINLRNQRKARARVESEAHSASNRGRFGRSLHERRLEKDIKLKSQRDLDGKRIESGDES
jgi:hypothetical protein